MKIAIISLGCPKNQVDADVFCHALIKDGHTTVADPAEADIIIINTCCFINDAKEESINTILEMAEHKRDAKLKALIVTGCLAQRYKEEIRKEIPEVDAILGTNSYEDIVNAITEALGGKFYENFETLEGLPKLTAKRSVTTGGHFAYLKIAEGCNKRCTYCIIPYIRGNYRSVPMEELVAQAKELVAAGAKELILVAQETTLYGVDLYGEKSLHKLLDALNEIPGLFWIRIMYCYPEEIYEELIDAIARNEKVCHYLDLPIQHCDEEILRRMHRPGNEETLRNLITHIRERVPEITLRTTLITGFPGETKEQFNRLGDFVQDMQFDHLGCFAYSEEEGTKAAEFEDQVDEDVRAHRADILMEQQAEVSAAKNAAKLGKRMTAVVEGYDKYAGCYFGRTAADAPDIDGKVFIKSSSRLRLGQYITVEVFDTMDYDLLAEEVTDEPAE